MVINARRMAAIPEDHISFRPQKSHPARIISKIEKPGIRILIGITWSIKSGKYSSQCSGRSILAIAA
jgi:hypothetical protein